jgi:2-polyprenyl-6-methoxyphenol hydroxylase-like FAD-dependent oxidoreductase
MTSTLHAEVVIVGAGVSGLALAIALGREGVEVSLVDKAPLPRDKVCGEGVMPLGLRCLAALGVNLGALPGVDFDGLDYLAWTRGGARRHGLRFPPGVSGRGLRRTRLVEALERAALAHPSVRVVRDEVRGVEAVDGRVVALHGQRAAYRAAVFVAADGVNSRLARWCGAEPVRFGERMGLRRHFRVPPEALPPRVQVGLLGRHDLYLTPVAPDELLATTLTDRAGYRAIAGDYEGFLRSGPYAEWFAGAEPAASQLAWCHPLFHARHYVAGGVFLVGDAGGGIDPCLGMGMSLGLAAARSAGESIAGLLRGRSGRAAAENRFARERTSLYLHYHPFGRVFRTLVGSPRGAGALLWAMGRLPRMAERLLAIVADRRPWRSLWWPSAAGPIPPEVPAVSNAEGRPALPLR